MFGSSNDFCCPISLFSIRNNFSLYLAMSCCRNPTERQIISTGGAHPSNCALVSNRQIELINRVDAYRQRRVMVVIYHLNLFHHTEKRRNVTQKKMKKKKKNETEGKTKEIKWMEELSISNLVSQKPTWLCHSYSRWPKGEALNIPSQMLAFTYNEKQMVKRPSLWLIQLV